MAVLFVLPTALDAQNTIKIRLFGNSARFLGEPRGEEVQYPMITNSLDTNINYTGFTHQG